MGYIICDLPNVEIRAHFGSHQYARRSKTLFEGVDAIIPEAAPIEHMLEKFKHSSGSRLEGHLLSMSTRPYDRELIHQARQVPIYLADTGLAVESGWKSKAFRAERGKSLPDRTVLSDLLLSCRYVFTTGAIPSSVINRISAHARVQHAPAGTGRSAVVAQKIEQAIVPYIQARVQRKPILGLAYGLGHADILTYLQDPQQRQECLQYMFARGDSPFDSLAVWDIAELKYTEPTIGTPQWKWRKLPTLSQQAQRGITHHQAVRQ
jgi:hypothetical protein